MLIPQDQGMKLCGPQTVLGGGVGLDPPGRCSPSDENHIHGCGGCGPLHCNDEAVMAIGACILPCAHSSRELLWCV
jgi:hypothetical protein